MRNRLGAAAGAMVAATLLACGDGPTGEPLTVTVPAGAGLEEVVDTLSSREIIARPFLFRLYVRIRGADTEIRAGRYALRRGEAWRGIVDDLTAGRVLTERLTIPEGFTLDRMIPRIAAITGVSEDSVRTVVDADSAHVEWGVPGPGLEGYLFPDTYRFARGTSVTRVIETMVERYQAFWTPTRRARLDSLGMSERELVTLASIVQAEARRTDEMPLIAGVYENRLERGHPLQADPTVLYALGGPRERLLYAAIDSVADSPYNTYATVGLPPGPIGAPGELALAAALHPADTDFFYFVARPTGEHVFTRTLAEHNRAKARARREWEQARVESRSPADAVEPPDTADTTGGPGRPPSPADGAGPVEAGRSGSPDA